MRHVGSEYVADVPIGRGSTGEVWRGSVTGTGQPVAIKLLDPKLAHDPDTVARFVQERSILTGIRSAHLVGVHDLVVERDTLAIVMDLVPGVDLRHHLRRVGSLAPGLATELIGQVLGALSVVHRAGIVHRDVKPENVLLDLTEAERPRALLTDFGIARIVRGQGASRPSVAGTLRYMAPEVARSGEATTASDLYSTGVVLYELLSGRPPFGATEPFSLLRAHELEQPAPIEGLPGALQSVLAQLMAKRPVDRPASATAARQMLAAAAVEVRGLTALPLLGDTDLYNGPTLPPALGDPPATAAAARPQPDATQGFTTSANPSPEPSVEPTVVPVGLTNSASGLPAAGALRAGAEPADSGVAALGTLLLSGEEPGAVPTARDGSGHGTVGGAFYGDSGDEPPNGRRGLIGLGVLAVVAIGLVLALIAFWNSGSSGPTTTPTPSALHTPAASVTIVPPVSQTASPTESPTPTVSPTPQASKTPQPKPKVPNVIGLNRAGAVARLEAAGLTRVTVVKGCFTGHHAGRVVSQSPFGGTTVSGKRASIQVQGAQCRSVPGVVGQNVAQAVLTLRAAGFTDVRNGGGGLGQMGRVSAQTPKGGTSALPSQTIVLTLSDGRAG